MLDITLDLDKIPKEHIYNGKTGKKLFLKIGERKEADKYGNTHYAYLWDKDKKEKIYIGNGTEKEWSDKPQTSKRDDLPF